MRRKCSTKKRSKEEREKKDGWGGHLPDRVTERDMTEGKIGRKRDRKCALVMKDVTSS